MSVNFRISSRLAANKEASKYLDKPPVPNSMSRLSSALQLVVSSEDFQFRSVSAY